MSSVVAIVVAVARNNVIGLNGRIPWHLQSELNYFKQITTGKPVIMGRKTYDSISHRLRQPLPNRYNIIVSNNANYQPAYADDSVALCSSIEQSLSLANYVDGYNNDEIMIIGGAQIYRQALPLANKIYRTLIDLNPEGDVWFEADENNWLLIAEQAKVENNTNYYCQQLIRKWPCTVSNNQLL